MSSSLKLASRSFPSRVADLGFAVDLPADWIAHELPNEATDFSDPTAFHPLAVVTAPHAALIVACVARPAYEDGTLHDWAWYLLNHDQQQPRAVGRGVVAGAPAVVGESTKASDMGPMVVRFAFFEDGGRLVNITFAAPELLADAVREVWSALVSSFRLESPRGSRFPLETDADQSAARSPADASVDPTASAAGAADANPSADAAEQAAPAATAPTGTAVEMTVPAGISPRKCRFSDFALADDTASLDPEHRINANLRDRGIGLVPNILATSPEARRVSLGAGAIEARMDLPFGWHVIDDGRRTLVLDPRGKVQINLEIIPRDDRDDDVILDAIKSDARDAYPAPHFERRTDGALRTLSVRNIADGNDPIEQHHILRQHGRAHWVVRARVTATPETSTDAWILGTLIQESLQFPVAVATDEEIAAAEQPESDAMSEPEPSHAQTPAWWDRALALEAQDQFEAAENAIRAGCPHIGFAASSAEMYRQRMNRLKAAGDRAGALDAFKRASDFIDFYASLATSGGEGAALSYERDQFRARLVAELGYDPEARCA